MFRATAKRTRALEPEQTATLVSSAQSSNFDKTLPFDVMALVRHHRQHTQQRCDTVV
jgi:hypothetical protein